MHFDIGIALLVFGVIFLAELPDKSLFASLVLGNRFPPLFVWLGVASAFLTHVILAVAAAKLLTLLPHTAMELIIAGLFFAGAMMLFFGKHGVEETLHKEPHAAKPVHNPLKIFATSFAVVFIGEWGDITQIATANYAAKYHDPVSVAVGATAGLWCVSALAILFGSKILNRIPRKPLLRFMGCVMLLFSALSIVSAVK